MTPPTKPAAWARPPALPCLAAAARHPRIAAAVVALGAGAAWVDARHGKPLKGVVYLGTMLLAVLAADLLARRSPPPEQPPVRRPGPEAMIALLLTLAGILAIHVRFAGEAPWGERSLALRLPVMLGLLLCTMPTALAGWLLVKGYRPRTLGFLPRGLAAGAAALLLTAAAAALADPGAITLWRALDETGGWGALLLLGFVNAALPEEFGRLVLQTRWGAALRNPAAGWVLATLAWAAFHVPNFAWQAGGDTLEGALGALRIVPLGLLWGYLARRTGSLLPGVLAHGLNFWGLQNS